jgi:hypothetical protein
VSGAIFKSTAVTGVATLVSRITGLAREMIYAQAFGASAFMDAWLVAFKIPNFLRRLFAEGSFSQAFVPVISEYKMKRSKDEARELSIGRGHLRRGPVLHHLVSQWRAAHHPGVFALSGTTSPTSGTPGAPCWTFRTCSSSTERAVPGVPTATEVSCPHTRR